MSRFNRHDLVWLKPGAVELAHYAGPVPMQPELALSLLNRWVLGGYPLIVARQSDVPAGLLRVGLAEPASWGKRRLSFVVNQDEISRQQQGPELGSVLNQLPQVWNLGANALHALVNEHHVVAHVYGSSAIQALTGLQCITPQSDLDMLFKPASWASAKTLCTHLDALKTQFPELKLDGEVLSPTGHAVQWEELFLAISGKANRLLAKTNTSVDLIQLDEYRQTFEVLVQGAA